MNNIQLLKELTQTTYDSVQGYTQAAQKAEKPGLQRAFEQRRDQRAQILSAMNRVLVENNEEAVTSSSVSRAAHEVFTGITDALSKGDEAVIERVEEGEDHILGEFRDALEDDAQTDPKIRMVIERAYNDIKEGERFTDMLERQYA